MIKRTQKPKISLIKGRSYFADHGGKLKTRYLLLLFFIKVWEVLTKMIQKIKCNLGWHKWYYGYLNEPELGYVAIRVCVHRCWRIETINAATGHWERLVYDKNKLRFKKNKSND